MIAEKRELFSSSLVHATQQVMHDAHDFLCGTQQFTSEAVFCREMACTPVFVPCACRRIASAPLWAHEGFDQSEIAFT